MLKSFLFFIFVFTAITLAVDQPILSKIYLKINGHEHPIADNVAQEFSNYYLSTRTEMIESLVGTKTEGWTIKKLKLLDDIDRFEYKILENDTIQVKVKIDSNSIKLQKRIFLFKLTTTADFTLNLTVKFK